MSFNSRRIQGDIINNLKTENKKHNYKVFIVDDHPIVRQGLTQLINQESDFLVCGDGCDIPQALKAIKKSKPDIIIIDIPIGHTNGIRLIEDFLDNYPNMSILVFSMHDEDIYAERCLKAGARGGCLFVF